MDGAGIIIITNFIIFIMDGTGIIIIIIIINNHHLRLFTLIIIVVKVHHQKVINLNRNSRQRWKNVQIVRIYPCYFFS